jgi:hypothetical protein
MLHELKPLSHTTMGEWIDLENAISENDIITIASYQYTPRIDGNTMDYESCLAAFQYYLTWRNNILDHYKHILSNGSEQKDDIEIYKRLGIKKTISDEEVDEDLDQFNKVFSWYDVLFTVFAGSDYMKMKDCMKLKVIEVFNHLSYLQMKNNLK